MGGCHGDPHCYTFDGVKKWGYQGLGTMYLIKPASDLRTGRLLSYDSMPDFDIRMVTAQGTTQDIPGISYVDRIIVIIPEWGDLTVQIGAIQTQSAYGRQALMVRNKIIFGLHDFYHLQK